MEGSLIIKSCKVCKRSLLSPVYTTNDLLILIDLISS